MTERHVSKRGTNDLSAKFGLLKVDQNLNSTIVWDSKRQMTWLAAGIILGTFVAYSDAHLEDGTFVPSFFIFMESLVLLIVAGLFYFYSRKKG